MTGSAAAGAGLFKSERFKENTRFGERPETISLKIREPGSALTHFAGLILTAVGAGPLIGRAAAYGSGYTVAGMIIFVITSCVLYAASSTYHTIVGSLRATTVCRKIDHSSISLMIAGTYTPVCLTALRGSVGIPLLIAIWVLAAGGVAMKLLWITCPKWVSSLLYIMMGWLCVFAMGPILSALPRSAFLWLLAGGIAYSVGAVIYALKPKAFDERHIYFGSHEIFHVFIMAGTFCHYVLMVKYIVYFT